MILILTHTKDLSADLVIRHLIRKSSGYIRLNTDEIGTSDCFFGFNQEPELVINGRVIHTRDIKAVWARRFALPASLGMVAKENTDFVRRELLVCMDAFLEGLDHALQMNSFFVDKKAGNRLIQCMEAQRVGFSVPETLVTQDEAIARKFVTGHEVVVTKALSFGSISKAPYEERVAFSTQLPDMFDLGGLRCCPSLFQTSIKKKSDWRITTVGNKVFAAKLPYKSDTHIDWRTLSNGAQFESAELSLDVIEKLHLLCQNTGLLFGAHDFVETPDGEFFFLETNPAGQWGWLELSLGMPIGSAIADLLMEA